MTACIIPFPITRARPAMTPAQRRIDLSNTATDPNADPQARADAVIELIATCRCADQADLWREYGEHLLADLKGGVA